MSDRLPDGSASAFVKFVVSTIRGLTLLLLSGIAATLYSVDKDVAVIKSDFAFLTKALVDRRVDVNERFGRIEKQIENLQLRMGNGR